MANNLGSLVVSLGLDAAEFTKGLSKSEYEAEKFARNMSKAADDALANRSGPVARGLEGGYGIRLAIY